MSRLMYPQQTECSDGQLIHAVLAGDLAAELELFKRFQPRLLSAAGRWAQRDPQRAEDLAQDTWAKAIAALPSFHVDRPFWPWLKQILDNTARNSLRTYLTPDGAQRVTPCDDQGLDRPVGIDDYAKVDLDRDLAVALTALSRRQRKAFVEVVILERDRDGVAAELGLNANALRQLISRARKTVQDRLAALALMPLFGSRRWRLWFAEHGRGWLAANPGIAASAAQLAVATALVVQAGVPAQAMALPGRQVVSVQATAPDSVRVTDFLGLGDTLPPLMAPQDHSLTPEPSADSGVLPQAAPAPRQEGPPVDVPSTPDVAVDNVPITVDSEPIEDPDREFGVRVPLPQNEQTFSVASEEDQATRPLDEAACSVASAGEPITFCETD